MVLHLCKWNTIQPRKGTDFRFVNNADVSPSSCEDHLPQMLSHLSSPFSKVPSGRRPCGKGCLLEGRWAPADPGRSKLYWKCFASRLWCGFTGSGFMGGFIQTVNFIVCRFYLSQANNRQKTQLPSARPLGPALPPWSPYQM